MERLSHPRRPGARNHLDSRWSGSDARRRAVGRAQTKPGAASLQFRSRPGQQCLSCRRRAGRARIRLAHRSGRPEEAVLHHAVGLSHGDGGHRIVLERLQLRAVPLPHRRRHRRRIHRNQFDHPGTGAGALSGLDRSRHQRQFLDRRRARRGQRDLAARSRVRRSRRRLAPRLSGRRMSRPDRAGDAHLDSGEPALADDPRSAGAGRGDRRGHRAVRATRCNTARKPAFRKSSFGCAATRRLAK